MRERSYISGRTYSPALRGDRLGAGPAFGEELLEPSAISEAIELSTLELCPVLTHLPRAMAF